LGSYDFRSFHARLGAVAASRLVRPSPIISDSPRRRDGVSARTISDHFTLASAPWRRLGSYDFRSFHARLGAVAALRLARPFPIISRSPRRRDGASARTISDHFTLASAPWRRLGSYDFRSFQTRLVAATALRLARPFPIISDSPRRRDGASARTTISDHF